MSKSSNKVTFSLNGEQVTINNPDPRMNLNEYLRTNGHVGTKLACGEGGCGACTVTLSRYDHTLQKEISTPINSCLKPVCALDGTEVTTIEGLGSQKKGFHSLQKRIIECNGSQCGFCTPGMIMNMHGLLEQNQNPTQKQIEDHFDGNLCRCTGYRPILTAMKTFSCDAPDLSKCERAVVFITDVEEIVPDKYEKYSHKAKNHKSAAPASLESTYENVTWLTPTSLSQLYSLLQQDSQGRKSRLVFGNTSTGVFKDEKADVLINVATISELSKAQVSDEGAIFGSGVTLADVIHLLTQYADSGKYQPHQVSKFRTLVKHMNPIASNQIRSAGCWAGNLMISHQHIFPSDLCTIFMGAANAQWI